MKIYLNLLPEERKKQIHRAKRFKLLIGQEILFLLPLVIFGIMLFFVLFLLNMQLDSIILNNTKQSEQSIYKELDEYERVIKEFNGDVAAIKDISDKHLQWSKYLSTVASLMPEGVSISDMSTKEYQVFLVGEAKNRESMMKFKEALEGSACFESVNVPLSNLVAKENIEFQVDVTLKRDCLLTAQK